jgi:hypothetical protein
MEMGFQLQNPMRGKYHGYNIDIPKTMLTKLPQQPKMLANIDSIASSR